MCFNYEVKAALNHKKLEKIHKEQQRLETVRLEKDRKKFGTNK